MNGDRRLSHFGFTVEDNPPHPGYPQPPTTENSTPPVGYSQHVQPPVPPQGPYGPGVPRSTPATWMSRPGAYGCPPGLEYLTQVDHLFVKQKKEILEIMTGIETENRYDVLNALGQTVYRCVEEASYFQMSCCGASRAFTMHVYDNAGIEVVRIIRPYKYHCMQWCNCCKCCQDEVEVQSPVGTVAGYVTQMSDGCKIKYNIMDSNETSVLQLKGSSYCICECWGDMHFQVLSKDGTIPVGDVTKHWSGIVQEYFTDADNFGISFPMDLDVRIKAVLLGAAFLIVSVIAIAIMIYWRRFENLGISFTQAQNKLTELTKQMRENKYMCQKDLLYSQIFYFTDMQRTRGKMVTFSRNTGRFVKQ